MTPAFLNTCQVPPSVPGSPCLQKAQSPNLLGPALESDVSRQQGHGEGMDGVYLQGRKEALRWGVPLE